MYNLLLEYEKLKGEISIKEENLRRILEESSRVTQERDFADKRNKNLKQQLEEYRVPQVNNSHKTKTFIFIKGFRLCKIECRIA